MFLNFVQSLLWRVAEFGSYATLVAPIPIRSDPNPTLGEVRRNGLIESREGSIANRERQAIPTIARNGGFRTC